MVSLLGGELPCCWGIIHVLYIRRRSNIVEGVSLYDFNVSIQKGLRL